MDSLRPKSLSHRSKHRIKKLGEVFTPKECVNGMLSLLENGRKNFWCDENITFFEPCCGHGNIVIQVIEKRLSAIYFKAVKDKIKNPEYYAVANTINTLWAIDIDKKNIKQCRARVLIVVMEFLRTKLNLLNYKSVIINDKDFIAHILCAVDWHIHQNETLSAISNQNMIAKNACKTSEGVKWYKHNNCRSLNFQQNWVDYFKKCSLKKKIPIEYNQAITFVNSIMSNKSNSNQRFDFTDELLIQE